MVPSTLFCLHCGYNLTGLTENRCPECGHAFDPALISRPFYRSMRPISFWRVAARCLGLVIGTWGVVALLILLRLHRVATALLVIAVLLLAVSAVSVWNAQHMARRMALSRAMRRGPSRVMDLFQTDIDETRYVQDWSALLLFLQLILTWGSPFLVLAARVLL
ncbi:MAG: hypothetical protein JXB13_17575 [Phycisphaerae bacterium]|nr:hypothetical protein [Phycisphaerae bacterium]